MEWGHGKGISMDGSPLAAGPTIMVRGHHAPHQASGHHTTPSRVRSAAAARRPGPRQPLPSGAGSSSPQGGGGVEAGPPGRRRRSGSSCQSVPVLPPHPTRPSPPPRARTSRRARAAGGGRPAGHAARRRARPLLRLSGAEGPAPAPSRAVQFFPPGLVRSPSGLSPVRPPALHRVVVVVASSADRLGVPPRALRSTACAAPSSPTPHHTTPPHRAPPRTSSPRGSARPFLTTLVIEAHGSAGTGKRNIDQVPRTGM